MHTKVLEKLAALSSGYKDSRFLQNVGTYVTNYKYLLSQRRRPSSHSSMWEPQSWNYCV